MYTVSTISKEEGKDSFIASSKAARSAHPFLKEVTAETRLKNFATAVTLFGFVGFVYYTAISKMKGGGGGQDELDQVIDQESIIKKQS